MADSNSTGDPDADAVLSGSYTPPAAVSGLTGDPDADEVLKTAGVTEKPETLRFGPWDTGVKLPKTVANIMSGAGESMVNLAQGAGQDLGLVSRADVQRMRDTEAAMPTSAARTAGNVIGGLATALPASMIPGVNTVAGGAALGAGMGLLQPSTSTRETLTNTGLGTALGGIGSYIGGKIAGTAGDSLASREAASQAEASQNSVRDAVLEEGRAAGYKVPPTAVDNGPINTALESISGKAATRQVLSTGNQKVTDSLIASDLGIPQDQPLTLEAIRGARQQAGQVYQQVKGVGALPSDPQYQADLQRVLQTGQDIEGAYPGIGAQANEKVQQLVSAANVSGHDSSSLVDTVKFLRNRASQNFKSAFRSADPEKLDLARGQQGVADAMDDLMTRHLQSTGQSDLADSFQNARTMIAKSHQAEAAFEGGHVDATDLASQLDKGKPMSGGFGTVARFASQFGDVSKIPKSGAGVSKLAATLGLAGEVGAAAIHSPMTAAGVAAATAAPYVSRAGITSGIGQRLLATPSYGSGAIGNAGLRALQFGGRTGASLSGATSSLADLLNNPEGNR